MKNKILVLALIAAVLTAGLVLVGCNKDCPGKGECTWDRDRPFVENKDCDNQCINNRLKENSMRFVCNC